MLPFFVDLLSFFLKTLIIILVVAIPIGLVVAVVLKTKDKKTPSSYGDSKLIIRDLKSVYDKRKKSMIKALNVHDPDKKIAALDEKKKKKKDKKEDKELKLKDRQAFVESLKKLEEDGVFCPQNLYVVNFVGSTKGNEVKKLRREIDAILDVATSKDEVIVNLTSPGGMVNSYGLCASQLARIRDRGIRLTCTVDSVAASGGYLMACVADHIVAAPFSYIGSIGVIAGIPNFRKVLNKYDVDYEQVTAGKYKRTLSMLGENTQEGREKFKEEFTKSALGVFGSGWTWLVKDNENNLKIMNTANAGNPITEGFTPLMVIDVWEHAYYIDYRNNRAAFIENFWSLVNWNKVAERL